jgi:hypothetical protein
MVLYLGSATLDIIGLARTVYTYIHTVHDRMYGDFPARNTVYALYIPINVWSWPTLHIYVCTEYTRTPYIWSYTVCCTISASPTYTA